VSDHPIFIVGAPRSGTTLLASMLASHSRIGCGPETQFFNKISPLQFQEALHDPVWPQKAIELITSLTLTQQKVYELFALSREEIADFLSKQEPSIRALLESLTATYAFKLGKPRWAEKTPNHLLHLDLIRQEFPRSPIIRIVRDPRDSAISMQKLPWASQSVLANGYFWDEWFQKSKLFFESDDNHLTVRYEDLISQPYLELQNICSFINEEFESGMLSPEKASQSVMSPNETWKLQNAKPLNSTRTLIWKKELVSPLQDAVTFSCIDGIEKFGYEFKLKPTQTLQVYPFHRKIIEQNGELFLSAAEQGIKLVKSPSPIAAGELLILPSFDSSIQNSSMRLLHFLAVLIIRQMQMRPVLYMQESLKSTQPPTSRLAKVLIKLLGKEYTLSSKTEGLGLA
jgi:hypothetical protein